MAACPSCRPGWTVDDATGGCRIKTDAELCRDRFPGWCALPGAQLGVCLAALGPRMLAAYQGLPRCCAHPLFSPCPRRVHSLPLAPQPKVHWHGSQPGLRVQVRAHLRPALPALPRYPLPEPLWSGKLAV